MLSLLIERLLDLLCNVRSHSVEKSAALCRELERKLVVVEEALKQSVMSLDASDKARKVAEAKLKQVDHQVRVSGRPLNLCFLSGPDLQNILRQSYDHLKIIPTLRSTYLMSNLQNILQRMEGFS